MNQKCNIKINHLGNYITKIILILHNQARPFIFTSNSKNKCFKLSVWECCSKEQLYTNMSYHLLGLLVLTRRLFNSRIQWPCKMFDTIQSQPFWWYTWTTIQNKGTNIINYHSLNVNKLTTGFIRIYCHIYHYFMIVDQRIIHWSCKLF